MLPVGDEESRALDECPTHFASRIALPLSRYRNCGSRVAPPLLLCAALCYRMIFGWSFSCSLANSLTTIAFYSKPARHPLLCTGSELCETRRDETTRGTNEPVRSRRHASRSPSNGDTGGPSPAQLTPLHGKGGTRD